MISMNVKLHLKNHCIETEAKKKLKNLIDFYFESSNNQNSILYRIELLQQFIKESDFPKLRASDEKFSGAIESIVCIYRDNKNNINFSIDPVKIDKNEV